MKMAPATKSGQFAKLPRFGGWHLFLLFLWLAVPAAAAPVPWSASRVKGTPEPPPPYRTRKVYEHVRFSAATSLAFAPGCDRCFVTELFGKVYSLPADRDCRKADLFIDIADLVTRLNAGRSAAEALGPGVIYHLAFDPDFATNRFCYLCYTVGYRDPSLPPFPESTRVVRLTVIDTVSSVRFTIRPVTLRPSPVTASHVRYSGAIVFDGSSRLSRIFSRSSRVPTRSSAGPTAPPCPPTAWQVRH